MSRLVAAGCGCTSALLFAATLGLLIYRDMRGEV